MEKIAKYYNVNADIIVSEYMNIVKADESLFMFLGETSNLIFTHAIYPADVVKFETAIKEVDEGEQVYVSIRLKSRDGDYRWMRVFIKPYHDKTSGRYYNLEITDMYTLKRQNEELKQISEIQTEFLSIIGDYLFTYNIGKDSLRIILPGNGSQTIVLYEGKLGVWSSEKLDNRMIDGHSIKDFEGLCMAIASGESYFTRDIKMKLADYDEAACWYTFKGKRVHKNDGENIIVGAISLTQNKEYPAEDVSVQDELRDAGTELLAWIVKRSQAVFKCYDLIFIVNLNRNIILFISNLFLHIKYTLLQLRITLNIFFLGVYAILIGILLSYILVVQSVKLI